MKRVRIEFSTRNAEEDVHREVDIRAREHMSKDRKLSYAEATRAVFVADPDLHRAYLAELPPVHAPTED